tara:strand:- start:1206 stop:1361 length:156 start_codon:yes stop_codon:yes gene_type:complete
MLSIDSRHDLRKGRRRHRRKKEKGLIIRIEKKKNRLIIRIGEGISPLARFP